MENKKIAFDNVLIGLNYYDLCFIVKGLKLYLFSCSICNGCSNWTEKYINSLIDKFNNSFKEFNYDKKL